MDLLLPEIHPGHKKVTMKTINSSKVKVQCVLLLLNNNNYNSNNQQILST